MSTRHLAHRSLAALSLLPLATLFACASGHKTNTHPNAYVADTSSVGNRDGQSIEQMFEGRFPGVTVTQTSGGLQIRIRGGNNSFYGSSEPLYVVDDTPLPSGTGGIVFLNPYDIQRIEILKNPADVALYGLRGGNGVIKITTKRSNRR